ncbi:MAG TPA: alpha-glucuronidase family glycosyl hydrolase [Polyangia bacterium]|nr:alpha-glucuronidase family glycosyl hydrolase [Polyangia bacterium]
MEDGYRLWLRYPVARPDLLAAYRAAFTALLFESDSPTLSAAREELTRGLGGLLGGAPALARARTIESDGALIVGTPTGSPVVAGAGLGASLADAGNEGFVIRRATVAGRACTIVAGNRDVGALYGAFHLLRLLQTETAVAALDTVSAPRIALRMLDHWDNLDGTIERGYAGHSLWDWHKLPDYLSPRYEDYARADASIGINAVSLTNVNADPLALTAEYLPKVAALADVFRRWGIRVFLTARFSSPIELGGLATADPLDDGVRAWWRAKAEEIYRQVPDFGGFLVKASSEGQPGPQDYGRTHADGANVLADAVAPGGGTVIWRAFVYRSIEGEDRHKQAYAELTPQDGRFRPNVALQVKNGAIDFQPREPFHPLFGAMPKTPLFLEVMLAQEYLGFATHLVFHAPLIKETLDADTFARGAGSTVARVVDGSLHAHAVSGMAGVANTGDERNWTGHPFLQANWYAFGRLAWDHQLGAEAIAEEWLRMTYGNDPRFVAPAKAMMLGSREAPVSYMTPLGLHHLMAKDHHHGPGPWVSPERERGRADWTAVYYHRADAAGIGFDRSATGSNAVAQYNPPLDGQFGDLQTCPEEYLLWFHHVRWDHVMRSGRTLWDELCHRYTAGVDFVHGMRRTWNELAPYVDHHRHVHVTALLAIQEKEARWWRDACLLYFQTFSKRPFPADCEPPHGSLAEFMAIKKSHVPGI